MENGVPRNEGGQFAVPENVEECVGYINQTLQSVGLPAAVELTDSGKTDLASACNCILTLIGRLQADATLKQLGYEQQQRLISDLRRQERKIERVEGQVSAKEAELQSQAGKVLRTAAAAKVQMEKLQTERDEFMRMAQAEKQVRVQQTHELRKREREYSRLQDKLTPGLPEKKREPKSGVEILNAAVIDSGEAKRGALAEENTELKQTLRSVEAELAVISGSEESPLLLCDSLETSGAAMEDANSVVDLSELPYEETRGQVEERVRHLLAAVRRRMMDEVDAERDQYRGEQVADEDRQALQRWAAKLDEDQLELEEQKRALMALSPVLIERMQKYAARLPDGGGKPKSEGGWLSPLSKRLQEGSPPPLVKWSLAQEIGSDESPLKEAKRLSTSPIV